MRVIFMGTPILAATILEEIAQQHDVVAVYTRPDAVRARGKQLVASPVKAVAERLGLTVVTPLTLRNEEELQKLKSFNADVIVIAAYGMILPIEVLEAPRFGCLNVHASLLPRWRGAAPVERAILAGDEEVGVTIMRVVMRLDSGDYCVNRSIPIANKNAETLAEELAHLGAQAMLTALAMVEEGSVSWTVQDESLVVYAEKIAKGELDPLPTDDVVTVDRKVRASSTPHPARCVLAGRSVTMIKVRPLDDASAQLAEGLEPGELRWVSKRLLAGCANGAFEILEVKPDGKQSMTAAAFVAGVQTLRQGSDTWEGR